jgi:pimeloyl-ACP methyl ester carboxylesterase
MDTDTFHRERRFADVAAGRIAYIDVGTGPPALFVHGVPLNGYHWRHVIAGVRDMRRCIAPDLMGLGYSEIAPDQALHFDAQAQMLIEVLDVLDIDDVDLVGNDSGGAIAQIVAARHPDRVRTLTLTNCDVHDFWPPAAVLPTVRSAQRGVLATRFAQMVDRPERARDQRGLGIAYRDPSVLTDDVVRAYLAPLSTSAERAANLHRYFTSFDVRHTVDIEPLLRTLEVPTLLVWAVDDVFFHVDHGRWLRDTIPGSVGLIEVPDARLFFPEDRPDALVGPLRVLWSDRSPGRVEAP